MPREQKVIMTMMIVKKIKNGSRLVVKLKLKLIKLNTTFWKINNVIFLFINFSIEKSRTILEK